MKGAKETFDPDAQEAPRKWRSPQNLKALRQLRKSAEYAEDGQDSLSAFPRAVMPPILAKRSSIKPEGDFDGYADGHGMAIFSGGDELP